MNRSIAILMIAVLLPSASAVAENPQGAEGQAVAAQEQRFESLDANGDNAISRNEAKGDIDTSYGLVDLDDSGSVEFSEFSAWEEMNLITE